MVAGNMTRVLPTGWGLLKSITPCRLLSDLPKSAEITRSDSRADRSESGYPVVGGLFDVVSTALCAGLGRIHLNAVMGTQAVTSGITYGLRDGEAHPYVYGRYVNDGQFIVHEASPTSSGNLEWFTTVGEISFAEINQAVASLPKAGGDLFPAVPVRQQRRTRDDQWFLRMQAIHTRAHLLQAIYEGVVFSHMTHLNRMRERFTDVHTLRVTGGPAHSMSGCKCWRTSAVMYRAAAGGRNCCFGAAPPASVPGFIAISAKPNVTCDTGTHPAAGYGRASALPTKYQRYQHLIAALQGYHARIKEHIMSRPLQLALDHSSLEAAQRRRG